MPETYGSGATIPELAGTIYGGSTAIFHEINESKIMESMLEMARVSAEPMHLMYGLMNSPVFHETGIAPTPNAKGLPDWREVGETELTHDGVAMAATLSLANYIWRSQPPNDLFMSCTVGSPATPDAAIDFKTNIPMLAFHRGSLLATVVKGPLRVFKYAIALFPGRGIGMSQRAERIMEDFRVQALQTPGVEPLSRLEEIDPGALRNKPGVLLFLHGLLSIDVGLFDGLIRKVHADPSFQDYECVGWPHDTLASIDDNAQLLQRWIENRIGLDGPNIVLIAHSRGGLLARALAVRLYGRDQRWRDKLKGCITFGTPHEGCPLAEAPGDMIGKVVTGMASARTKSLATLADALWYVHGHKTVEGVEDLRPVTGGGTFLKQLLDKELAQTPSPDERILDILAIGGKCTRGGVMAGLSRRALAGTDNDLVVETRSSAPALFAKTRITDCDHFSYFEAYETMKPHYTEVLAYLRQAFGIPAGAIAAAAGAGAAPASTPTVSVTDTEVNIGGIKVFRHPFKFRWTDARPPGGDT